MTVRLEVLTKIHAREIGLLLTRGQRVLEVNQNTFPTSHNFVLSWDLYVDKRATQIISDIDELLARFKTTKRHLRRKPTPIQKRGVGRPREEQFYWLARELAFILESMPGFKIAFSKSRPTKFMKVLHICFSAVGHSGSLERVAREATETTRQVPFLE